MARLSTVLILLFASLFSSSVFANTCEGPDSINALIVQADNVLLNWEPKASSYTIEYGLTGFVPGSGSQESTADTSIRIQSLVEKSVYDFYLISDCGGGMLDTIGPKIIETLYYNDIGISLLNAPQTACDLTNMEDITISISNYGQNPQQLFDFGYSLDFVEQEVNRPFDGFYTGVVGYDSTVMTTFDIKAPIGIPGKYIFQVWTDLQEDSDNDNDTLTVEVFHQPVINDYPYEWDFEEWEGGWVIHDSVSSNSSLQYGRPNSPEIQSAYSGTKAWVTNLIGDYNANERSILISPCFDFSNMVNDPYMSFALHYQGEACCDFSQAEISINGGLNWTKIGDGENGINWYNDNDENRWNGDGVAAGWSNVQNRLFGAAGRDSVRLRFVFESDHTNQGSGIGIDDIRIYEPYTIDLATAFVDHTSEIECGFDADKVLIAVENTGLNAVDQYLINYRFNGGPIVSESIFGIDVNDRDTFEFATPISTNMDGDYNVVAWVNAGGERNRVNDSLSLNFIIQGVKPLPLRQDFEDSDFPTGWTADEMNFGIDHGSPSSVFYDRLNIDDISFELLAPNVGTISTTDTLQFDYRIVNAVGNGTVGTSLSSGDQLLVQVSENCGINYANLLIIDPSNHVFSADMQTIKIGLETYVGKDIKIKFIGQRAAGDFFVDIDNVEINGCPMNLGLSLTQLNPSDLSSSDGSLSVQPTLGTSPYTYAWDNLSNTASLSDLAVGTYMVSVTDADGCMDTATSALEACPSSLGLTVTTTPESGLGNNGTAMVIASSGTAPYSFTWDSGVQTDMLYDLSLGSYFVTVTDNFGCADEIEAIVDLQTGNHIISDLIQFQLFPNPAQSESVINLELGSAKSVGLHVFNSLGQEILNEISSVSRQHFFTLDTSEYPNGIYFVKVIAGNQFVSKRLFVQH